MDHAIEEKTNKNTQTPGIKDYSRKQAQWYDALLLHTTDNNTDNQQHDLRLPYIE